MNSGILRWEAVIIGPYRIHAFAMLSCATVLAYWALRRRGGDDGGLLVVMGGLGAVWGVAVIADTVYHAWKGQGSTCMHCGHRRQMASFRVHSPCPKCQK